MKRHLTIATRKSPLALIQAEWVKNALLAHHPHLSVALLGLVTEGDQHLATPLAEIGGKGLFIKALEEALLDGRADIAVHSMKDVPMTLPAGLCLPVIPERADARDVLVSNQYHALMALPQGAVVGTGSLRRRTQLLAARPDIVVQPIRGNLQTRLRRLDRGEFDALVLAGAGLMRMGLTNRIRCYLELEVMLPAPGQGALAIECREDDETTQTLLKPLHHESTAASVMAERAMCRKLGGGCHAPVAALGMVHHHVLTLKGLVAGRDGLRVLQAQLLGDPDEAIQIGETVAEDLLQQGAAKLLREFHE
jgi:hydroxymethylbilane synthase